MKILYMTPFIYAAAGTERVLSMKANYLVREAGMEVVIVTTDQKERKNFFDFDERIKHYDLGLNYEDDFNRNILSKYTAHKKKNNIYRKKLSEIISQEKPDVCVSLFGREIEFIGKMKLSCKTVAELHFNKLFRYHIIAASHQGWLWKLVGKYRTWQLIKETRCFDRVVVLTKQDKKEWDKTNDNVYQIYNPVPCKSEIVSTLEAKTIISVGRLSYQKNYHSLIRAWKLVYKKHPDWTLNIYGDGELRDSLQTEIDRNELGQSLHLCGRTNEVFMKYLQSSAFVMTSRFEGFPMVLLEAATFGLPLISYDCYCGPRDIIDNNQNGYIVPINKEAELADAICKVIEDESLRRKMGAQSRNTSSFFSQEKVLPLWPEFFKSLVNLSL